jgi:hypothetical protein
MIYSRISIFTGHFGSGKTEVALNFAFKLSVAGKATVIVDFDIVNPYFRTSDARQDLKEAGIKLIAPVTANTNVDVPAIPAEIYSVFEDKSVYAVIDVGGDDIGARVLSRFRHEIKADDCKVYFVVNINRPLTDTVDKIISMMNEIETSSGMPPDYIVNNTNTLEFTTQEDIEAGFGILNSVSMRTGVPIVFTSGFGKPAEAAANKTGTDLLLMRRHIFLPWDSVAQTGK